MRIPKQICSMIVSFRYAKICFLVSFSKNLFKTREDTAKNGDRKVKILEKRGADGAAIRASAEGGIFGRAVF